MNLKVFYPYTQFTKAMGECAGAFGRTNVTLALMDEDRSYRVGKVINLDRPNYN